MIGLYLAKYLVVNPVSENTIINLDFISYAICTAEHATISLVLRGRSVLNNLYNNNTYLSNHHKFFHNLNFPLPPYIYCALSTQPIRDIFL